MFLFDLAITQMVIAESMRLHKTETLRAREEVLRTHMAKQDDPSTIDLNPGEYRIVDDQLQLTNATDSLNSVNQ